MIRLSVFKTLKKWEVVEAGCANGPTVIQWRMLAVFPSLWENYLKNIFERHHALKKKPLFWPRTYTETQWEKSATLTIPQNSFSGFIIFFCNKDRKVSLTTASLQLAYRNTSCHSQKRPLSMLCPLPQRRLFPLSFPRSCCFPPVLLWKTFPFARALARWPF